MKLKLNIRTKLVLLLVVFSALPLMAVMPIVFSRLNDMQQGHLDDMQVTAEEIGEVIDRNLFERYGDVQAFGANAASKNKANWYSHGAGNPLIASMDAYMTNYGLYKIMLLVDMDGKVAAVNSTDNKGIAVDTAFLYAKNFKDADWFAKASKKEFLKSDILDGTAVLQPRYEPIVSESYKGEDGFTIPFTAPVYDYSGEMIGIWVNFADFGLVEDIVKDVHKRKTDLGEQDIAFAIGDEKGTILMNYDPAARKEFENRMPDTIGKKTLADMEIPANTLVGKQAAGTNIEVDTGSGEEDAVGWTKTDGALGYPGLGWTVIMHQPGEHAFAEVVSTKLELEEIMGAAAILIIISGAVIGAIAARPLRVMSGEVGRLSEGDYSHNISGTERSDEIGDMARALNDNVNKIRETVKQIIQSARSVNTAASEIASGSADLSMRTEQQASNLEETAASMEEITGVVKQNSENATNANDLSTTANENASAGGQVVEKAVKATGSIEQSSQKIADIIGVSDEIAFQTN